ncbi:MAG: hypothetical protein AAF548_15170 [Actinomycetota bacterium]
MSDRERALEYLKGSSYGLSFLSATLFVLGLILGSIAASDVDELGVIAFSQAVTPWWITAGLSLVGRVIAMTTYWRIAVED